MFLGICKSSDLGNPSTTHRLLCEQEIHSMGIKGITCYKYLLNSKIPILTKYIVMISWQNRQTLDPKEIVISGSFDMLCCLETVGDILVQMLYTDYWLLITDLYSDPDRL